MRYIRCYNTKEECKEHEYEEVEPTYRDKEYHFDSASTNYVMRNITNNTISFNDDPQENQMVLFSEGYFYRLSETSGGSYVLGDSGTSFFNYTNANDSVTFGDNENMAFVLYNVEECGNDYCLTGVAYNYEVLSTGTTYLEDWGNFDYFSFKLSGDSENVVYNAATRFFDDSGNTMRQNVDFYSEIFNEDFSDMVHGIVLFHFGVGELTGSTGGDLTCLTKLDPELVFVRESLEVFFNCDDKPQPASPEEDIMSGYEVRFVSSDLSHTYYTISLDSVKDLDDYVGINMREYFSTEMPSFRIYQGALHGYMTSNLPTGSVLYKNNSDEGNVINYYRTVQGTYYPYFVFDGYVDASRVFTYSSNNTYPAEDYYWEFYNPNDGPYLFWCRQWVNDNGGTITSGAPCGLAKGCLLDKVKEFLENNHIINIIVLPYDPSTVIA